MKRKKYLLINGDDFGYSQGVNRAIIKAFQEGILTSTSLMVTGEMCQEAVNFALENKELGVGLHLVLVCGNSALSPSLIPNLVNENGEFSNDPFLAGLNYFFNKKAREELKLEIRRQLELFQETGLKMSHVDGHLHLHCHPVVMDILIELSPEFNIKYIRLPHEELALNLAFNNGNYLRKLVWSRVFKWLKNYAQNKFINSEITCINRVYGLLETGNITENYLLNLIPQLEYNLVEIYSHPDFDSQDGILELEALLSDSVQQLIKKLDIELINYNQIGEKISEF